MEGVIVRLSVGAKLSAALNAEEVCQLELASMSRVTLAGVGAAGGHGVPAGYAVRPARDQSARSTQPPSRRVHALSRSATLSATSGAPKATPTS